MVRYLRTCVCVFIIFYITEYLIYSDMKVLEN